MWSESVCCVSSLFHRTCVPGTHKFGSSFGWPLGLRMPRPMVVLTRLAEVVWRGSVWVVAETRARFLVCVKGKGEASLQSGSRSCLIDQ